MVSETEVIQKRLNKASRRIKRQWDKIDPGTRLSDPIIKHETEVIRRLTDRLVRMRVAS